MSSSYPASPPRHRSRIHRAGERLAPPSPRFATSRSNRGSASQILVLGLEFLGRDGLRSARSRAGRRRGGDRAAAAAARPVELADRGRGLFRRAFGLQLGLGFELGSEIRPAGGGKIGTRPGGRACENARGAGRSPAHPRGRGGEPPARGAAPAPSPRPRSARARGGARGAVRVRWSGTARLLRSGTGSAAWGRVPRRSGADSRGRSGMISRSPPRERIAARPPRRLG